MLSDFSTVQLLNFPLQLIRNVWKHLTLYKYLVPPSDLPPKFSTHWLLPEPQFNHKAKILLILQCSAFNCIKALFLPTQPIIQLNKSHSFYSLTYWCFMLLVGIHKFRGFFQWFININVLNISKFMFGIPISWALCFSWMLMFFF